MQRNSAHFVFQGLLSNSFCGLFLRSGPLWSDFSFASHVVKPAAAGGGGGEGCTQGWISNMDIDGRTFVQKVAFLYYISGQGLSQNVGFFLFFE